MAGSSSPVLRGHFTHVMKAGGTSFCLEVRARTPGGALFPPTPGQRPASKLLTSELLGLAPDARHAMDWFLPHMPASTADLCGPDLVTTTLLRDPTERALSHLRWVAAGLLEPAQRDDPRELTGAMRSVLEIDAYRRFFLEDHQARVLALGADELDLWDAACANHLLFGACARQGGGWTTVDLPVGPDRIDAARRRLDRLDVVGVLDRFPAFVAAVAERFAWEVVEVRHLNRSELAVAPDDIVDRLREANAGDALVVAHARALAAG